MQNVIATLENSISAQTCTWMFMAALFIIAIISKQPRCPSGGEWINCGAPRQ